MKIYVVTGTQGEYSDRSDWNVVAVTSESRAAELVEKLTKLTEYNQQFMKRIHPEFEEPWLAANPKTSLFPERPVPTREHSILLDRFSHGEGQEDERDLLRKLQAEHIKRIDAWKKVAAEADKIGVEHYNRQKDAEAAWKEANFLPPEELREVIPFTTYGYYSEPSYSYEELELYYV